MNIEQLYAIYLSHPQVSTDTRAIKPGSLFFALKGPSFNANEFAGKALELGAAYAIVDEPSYKLNDQCILVDNVLKTLQDLATYHRKQLQIPVIGITGTNGKTTTKELINAVLSKSFKTHATAGNLNNHIGVPLTILAIEKDVEMAIIEMGANHPGDIKELCDIALPGFGIITNVGHAHLEGFGSFEGVKKTKAELYDHIVATNGTIFINSDNEFLAEMSAAVEKRYTYSAHKKADIIGRIGISSPYLSVVIGRDGLEFEINTNLVGAYNFENVLAAVAVGTYFEMNDEAITAGIEEYTPSNNRSQVIKSGNNTILMDAYNANPSSMDAALTNFETLNADFKAVILGDMFELGTYSHDAHKKLVDKLLLSPVDIIILIGKAFGEFKTLAPHWLFFNTAAEAAGEIEKIVFNNTTILIKGSRGMKLETLLTHIKP